jgi:hypothetical protein
MTTEQSWTGGEITFCEEAEKLDEVREAQRSDDLGKANRLARAYRLTPVNES